MRIKILILLIISLCSSVLNRLITFNDVFQRSVELHQLQISISYFSIRAWGRHAAFLKPIRYTVGKGARIKSFRLNCKISVIRYRKQIREMSLLFVEILLLKAVACNFLKTDSEVFYKKTFLVKSCLIMMRYGWKVALRFGGRWLWHMGTSYARY